MKSKKLRIVLFVLVVVIVVVVGALAYLYTQGSVEHYAPPTAEAQVPEQQVLSDLSTLSQAIEAYYGANLKYPQHLDELQPDFIAKLPVEPVTAKQYGYETDGISRYRISVSNPGVFNLKELYVENGKLVKQ